MKDGHIHSPYCPHGTNDEFEEYIENAINIGLNEITFTEHLPLPNNFIDISPTNDSAMKEEELMNYINEVNDLKEKYKDKIKINVGVEVDYIQGYEKEIRDKLNKYGKYLDDSILSVHMIKIDDNYDLIDYNKEEFLNVINKLGSIENVYNKYYETVKFAINADLGKYKPRRIGHLNLVRKFNNVYEYDYSSNQILKEVVGLISKEGYELDFNISGLRKRYCQEPYIHGYLYDLVKIYDIKCVLGSDSHSAKDINYIKYISDNIIKN